MDSLPDTVVCLWRPEETYGPCSVTCGGGSQSRAYVCRCDNGVIDASQCSGTRPADDVRACNTQGCPRDCTCDSFGAFGSCAGLCGQSGLRMSTRTCQEAVNGGQSCDALGLNSARSQSCTVGPCPRDCSCAAWSTWSACSGSTCGTTGGTRTSRRTCTDATDGGISCTALGMVETRSERCAGLLCGVSCSQPNAPCSAQSVLLHADCVTGASDTCGADLTCSPALQSDGTACDGGAGQCRHGQCRAASACRVTEWSRWGQCSSETCRQARIRTVQNEAIGGGEACPALAEMRACCGVGFGLPRSLGAAEVRSLLLALAEEAEVADLHIVMASADIVVLASRDEMDDAALAAMARRSSQTLSSATGVTLGQAATVSPSSGGGGGASGGGGAAAGAAVGVLLALALVVGLLYYRRRQQATAPRPATKGVPVVRADLSATTITVVGNNGPLDSAPVRPAAPPSVRTVAASSVLPSSRPLAVVTGKTRAPTTAAAAVPRRPPPPVGVSAAAAAVPRRPPPPVGASPGARADRPLKKPMRPAPAVGQTKPAPPARPPVAAAVASRPPVPMAAKPKPAIKSRPVVDKPAIKAKPAIKSRPVVDKPAIKPKPAANLKPKPKLPVSKPAAKAYDEHDVVAVLFSFEAEAGTEQLSVAAGARVVPLEAAGADGWRRVRLGGRTGLVPSSYLATGSSAAADGASSRPRTATLTLNGTDEWCGDSGGQTATETTTDEAIDGDDSAPPRLYKAMYAYEPRGSEERALYEGEMLWIVVAGAEETADGWLLAADTRTLVPANHVEPADAY